MSAEGPQPPSEAELAEMDRDQLLKLGGQLDGVEIVDYPEPWPVKDTRAERRAQRLVAFWFALSALAGLAFVVVVAWPHWWEYKDPSDASGHATYSLYTRHWASRWASRYSRSASA